MTRLLLAVALGILLSATEARAQGRVRAATEAAEMLFGRYGAKAGRSVPDLAARIERVAAQHGDEAILAIRKGGPTGCALIEAAGPDAAKAVRVLATHGEQGASRVLSRPTAMKQFLQHGDEAATALVRHPGVAEPLVERGGAQAVKALGALEARSGRRLAMVLEGELAQVGRHPEILAVVAKYGERAMDYIWKHKEVLAGAAALAAFLSDPEPFLNGARDITTAVGDAVVKPVVGGAVTMLNSILLTIGVLIVAIGVVIHKYGMPSAETFESIFKIVWKR